MNQPKEVAAVQTPNILKPIERQVFKNFKGFTDSNDEFLNGAKCWHRNHCQKTAQLIKTELEKRTTDRYRFCILEKHIRYVKYRRNTERQEISKT